MRELSTGKPSGGGHPVGETHNQPFQLSFNRFLRVDFQGSRVTSDAGRVASDPIPRGGTDGLREGLGARRGSDLHAALVRDRLVGARGELDLFGEAQSGTGGPGGRSRSGKRQFWVLGFAGEVELRPSAAAEAASTENRAELLH